MALVCIRHQDTDCLGSSLYQHKDEVFLANLAFSNSKAMTLAWLRYHAAILALIRLYQLKARTFGMDLAYRH